MKSDQERLQKMAVMIMAVTFPREIALLRERIEREQLKQIDYERMCDVYGKTTTDKIIALTDEYELDPFEIMQLCIKGQLR